MRTGHPRPIRLSFTVDGRDVVVEAHERTAVGDVRAAAGLTRGELWLDGARLDDDAPLSATRLRDGCVVTSAPAQTVSRPPTHGWLLTVVSGPDSGAIVPIPLGTHDLGRGAVFSDPAMSPRHARLTVSSDGATVVSLGSEAVTTIDGRGVPADGVGAP